MFAIIIKKSLIHTYTYKHMYKSNTNGYERLEEIYCKLFMGCEILVTLKNFSFLQLLL